MIAWGLVAGLAGLAIGLAWLLTSQRRRGAENERLLAAADARLEDLQRQFERFAPAEVVERLTDGSGQFAPERRRVTMLFADLRGFTALCDRLDPAQTVELLNGYFVHMAAAVERHHGLVTEFVGDGLLALFGALDHNPWQARDAVLAGLSMREELALYNAALGARGLPELRFGIGIHGGEVIAGVTGTAGLAKFSVTGDPINVASRIEGLTREFGVDLLISDEIRADLGDQFVLRAMRPTRVKGKGEPIQCWFVESRGAATA